jgi:hypothetical protein
MFVIPHGEELAVFEDYPSAQGLVDTLVNGGVEASAVSIVGRDVTLVERVTAKVGYGRVALQSAVNGSWLGVIAGLVVVVVNPVDVVTPLLAGLLIGAGAGMVAGMVVFTLNKGSGRSYRSVHQVIAQNYRVVVNSSAHPQALKAMASTPEKEES